MAILEIFSKKEQNKFDLPPRFIKKEQDVAFLVTDEVKNFISKMRKNENIIGFVLQLFFLQPIRRILQ